MLKQNDTEWGDFWPDEIEVIRKNNPGIPPAECRRRLHRLNEHCKKLLWTPGEMPPILYNKEVRRPRRRPEDRS